MSGMIAMLAVLSIIGIPISLFIFAFPTVYLVLAISKVLSKVTPFLGKVRPIYSIVAAVVLLVLLPLIINNVYDNIHSKYLDGDIDQIEKPLQLTSLAVISGASNSSIACGRFCQRALLNGVVDKMVMVSAEKPHGTADFASFMGKAYWFEKRDKCPPPALKKGISAGYFSSKDINFEKKSSDDLIRFRSAQGICLISGDSNLDEVDAIIRTGNVERGKRPIEAAFNIFADTASVNRYAFYKRDNDDFKLIYQNTSVKSFPLAPMLIPTIYRKGQLIASPRFLRIEKNWRNEDENHFKENDSEARQNKFGFNLALDGTKFKSQIIDHLNDIANTQDELNSIDASVVNDFFEDFRRYDFSKEDANLSLKILQNPIIEAPYHTDNVIYEIMKTFPEMSEDFAHALFGKLKSFKPNQAGKSVSEKYRRLNTISEGINALPKGVTQNYFSHLDQLTQDPIARVFGHRVLTRLSEHGHKGAKKLLFLIEDSAQFQSKKRTIMGQWKKPTLAGLIGLCEMGKSGFRSDEILNQLFELSKINPKIFTYRDTERSTVMALLALGADSEAIFKHVENLLDDKDRFQKKSIERINQELKSATNDIDC